MTADTPVLEAVALCTRVAGRTVHEGLDLEVRRGEVLSLIGGSGAGKTVLLRHLIGLSRPWRGTVRAFGVDLGRAGEAQWADVRRRWGVLFQGGALFTSLDVLANVALPLREQRKLDEAAVRDVALSKLALVGLSPEDGAKRPAELSGGMVKRAALARALALDPELLVLDEPTAGLDPVSADVFQLLVRRLRLELRLTVFMITHDLETLSALSNRVAVLADRRVVTVGQLDDVARFDHPFVREYFSGPRARG